MLLLLQLLLYKCFVGSMKTWLCASKCDQKLVVCAPPPLDPHRAQSASSPARVVYSPPTLQRLGSVLLDHDAELQDQLRR